MWHGEPSVRSKEPVMCNKEKADVEDTNYDDDAHKKSQRCEMTAFGRYSRLWHITFCNNTHDLV